MDPCLVPELLDIFTKIVCDRRPYCYICLRTCDERRLVPPKNLKNFMSAVKITTNPTHMTICHICERQSYNALKLFRAATFATSVSRILNELCERGITNNQVLMDSKYFKRVLNKCALSSNLTPKTINNELKIIRNNSQLSETDTLVMDNSQIYETAAVPTVVAITTGQADINNSEAIHEAIIQCPILTDTCDTPAILPDREVTAEEIMKNKIPKPPETYVILDDEDDPLRPIHSDNQTNNVVTQPVIQQPNININNNLVVTTEPPNILTFQELLAQPNQKNINFLLHPIFLTPAGTLNIPSLSATITNGILLYQDATKTSLTTQPLGVNTDIIKQSLLLNKEVFLQSSNTGPAANNSNLTGDSCQNEKSNNSGDNERVRRDIGDSDKCERDGDDDSVGMWPQKRGRKASNAVKNVQISEISSDMDNISPAGKNGQGKTDWEDKIPMDVISFVDAVDPNAHKVLKALAPPPNGCDTMRLGDVRSLAPQATPDDVIDLC